MNSMTKEEFNKFAHEVKNPLAVCNGYLELIMKCSEKDKETYLQIVKDEIKRSLNIINDYSKNNTLRIEKEEVDLTLLYEDIESTLNNLLIKNNSEIILLDNDELYVEADYNKLKQVLINILKNSYEAKSNNKLLIVIKTKDYHDHYEISITDNGIGMSQSELKRIEEEYYTTKSYGTGLGIPYIKQIIKLHGGNIEYRSKKDIGTKVLIKLPKEKSHKTF